MEIKKISQALQDEGLTPALINSSFNYAISPVQIQAGDEPVTLMKANESEFWVKLSDGSFLKGDKGLIKFDLKTCMIARARYQLNYQEEEKKTLVEAEVDKLRKSVATKAEKIIKSITNVLDASKWSKESISGFEKALSEFHDSNYSNEKEEMKKRAQILIDKNGGFDKVEAYTLRLKELLSNEQYDELYMVLFSEGVPLIGKFDNDSKSLIDLFHRDVLQQTIQHIKGHNHLENVALINVTKLVNQEI